MRLEQQFDDILRQPGDAPGTSRRRHFGAKPKLWDTWVKLDEERNSTNELAAIKVCCISRSPSFYKPHIYCYDPAAALCYVCSARDKQAQGLAFLTTSAPTRTRTSAREVFRLLGRSLCPPTCTSATPPP